MSKADVKKRYGEIVDGLYSVFDWKLEQYGTGMYEDHSKSFRFWAAYFNIRRKTLRLERLTELALSEGSGDIELKLIDDYKDIANYAIMAVQILEEKNEV